MNCLHAAVGRYLAARKVCERLLRERDNAHRMWRCGAGPSAKGHTERYNAAVRSKERALEVMAAAHGAS